jgi:hypothetical protein
VHEPHAQDSARDDDGNLGLVKEGTGSAAPALLERIAEGAVLREAGGNLGRRRPRREEMAEDQDEGRVRKADE